MQRPILAVAATALIVGVAACGSGGIRPDFKPFPQAIVDTVHAGPAATTQALASEVVNRGMLVQWSSPAEGYLETQYYNVITRQSGSVDNTNRENTVLIRFWADSIGAKLTKVSAEVVYQRSSDPSLLPRDREQMVNRTHPGAVMAQDILKAAKERFGG